MYLSSNSCSKSLLKFHFTGAAIQCNFILKFHPTSHDHYPPTSPKLPHHYVPISPTVLPHYFPTFPTFPAHCSPTFPSSPPYQRQIDASNFQNGNVLSLGRQDKHVWLIVRQPLMKAGWWDAPLTLRDLDEAISMAFSQSFLN